MAGIVLAAVVPAALARSADEPLPQTSDEILIEPDAATPFLGEQLTITAVLHENATDCCNRDVRLVVLDGPNGGASFTAKSNGDGVATFTYSSATAGTDHLQAQFVDAAEHSELKGSNIAAVAWQHATVGLTVPDRPPALVKPPDENTFSGANDQQELPRGTIVDIGGNRAMTVQNYLGDKMTFVGIPDRVPSRFQLLTGVRSRIGVIQMNLVGGNFKACKTGSRVLSAAGALKKDKAPIRRLWGFGKGKYKTTGKYASATVRGTFWEIADFCNGTLIHVREGTVTVRDFTLKKNVTIEAGQSYFAKSPS